MDYIILVIIFLVYSGVREFLYRKTISDLVDKIKAKDLTEYTLYKKGLKPTLGSNLTSPVEEKIDFNYAKNMAKVLEEKVNEVLKETND